MIDPIDILVMDLAANIDPLQILLHLEDAALRVIHDDGLNPDLDLLHWEIDRAFAAIR